MTVAAVAADTPTVSNNRSAGAAQPRRRVAPAGPGPPAGVGGGSHDGAGPVPGGSIGDGGGASFDHGELLTFMLPIDSVLAGPLGVCRNALKGLLF